MSSTPAAATRRRFPRALDPRAWLGHLRSPILQKEVYVTGRRRATYATRCVYVLLMLALLVLAYASARPRGDATGVWVLQRLQTLAPTLVATVGWFQFVALVLIAPVLAGGALCDERRSGTLGTLFTTPLSAFQIALGKIGAALVQLVILTLLGAPVLLAVRVFGGVSTPAVLGITALGLCTALLTATLAMLHSVKARRGVHATVFAVIWVIVLSAAPSILLSYLAYKKVVPVSAEFSLILSPPATMFVLAMSMMGDPFPFANAYDYWWLGTIAYVLVLTLIAFVLLVASLRRVMVRDAGSPVVFAAARRSGRHRRAAPDPAQADPSSPGLAAELPPDLAAAAHRRRGASLVSHDDVEVDAIRQNPVLWRELRLSPFSRRWHLWAAVAFTGVLLAWLHLYVLRGRNDHEELATIVAAIAIVLSLLFAIVSGTGAITNERESRTLDSLLTTPMRASEIIRGKFWGALRRQWYLPVAVALHTLLVWAFDRASITIAAALHFALLWAGPVAFLTATGIWLSVRAKRSVTAAAMNFCIALAMWVLPFMCVGIAAGLGGGGTPEKLLSLLATANPVAMTVLAYVEGGRSRLPYDLFHLGTVGLTGFTVITAFFSLAYMALAAGALALAGGSLAERTSRRA